MHLTAAATMAMDARGRKRLLAALMARNMGFRQHPSNAWTWSFMPAEPVEARSSPAAPARPRRLRLPHRTFAQPGLRFCFVFVCLRFCGLAVQAPV